MLTGSTVMSHRSPQPWGRPNVQSFDLVRISVATSGTKKMRRQTSHPEISSTFAVITSNTEQPSRSLAELYMLSWGIIRRAHLLRR